MAQQARPIDYDALAKQFGGQDVAPPAVDYDALAKQFGGEDVAADFSTSNEKDASGQAVVRVPGLATIGEQLQSKHPHLLMRDVAVGAVKGVGNTLFGLGKIFRDYTPVGRISDAIHPGAFDKRPDVLQPTSTGERVGFTAEQVGEFFIPGAAATKMGQAVKSGALTLAQTGSPVAAGVSAAITAAIPSGPAIQKSAASLREGAEKTVAQALGPTKEWAKVEAAKLAPQMLARGVKGSREAMLAQAKQMASALGQELDNAYAAAAQAGDTVPGNLVRGHLVATRDALMVADEAGAKIAIPGTEPILAKLGELDDFVARLGPDVPVDKAAHIKRVWDQIVSKAGLYGPKAASSPTDSGTAWSLRESAGAFRELLNKNPTIGELNAEVAFWTGLKNVLKETQKRTQAQSGGLVQAGMGGAGVVAGALSGDSMSERATNAALGGLAGRQLVRLVQSPAWRTTVSGPLKQQLANALASGQAETITATVGRIMASLPPPLRPSLAQ